MTQTLPLRFRRDGDRTQESAFRVDLQCRAADDPTVLAGDHGGREMLQQSVERQVISFQ
jgi:hypothetical protein